MFQNEPSIGTIDYYHHLKYSELFFEFITGMLNLRRHYHHMFPLQFLLVFYKKS